MSQISRGPLLSIGAAILFGVSTPLAKLLLGGGADPWLLAGLLYLGSGIGLAISRLVGGTHGEAPLARHDLLWLALIICAGGVFAPVLLMIGLTTTPASSAALLLNLESLATMAIAWVVFRENVDRRLLAGAAAILAGAILLSWQGGAGRVGIGALAIAGACLAWGIDNNLTRKISAADPVQIAMLKGMVAGVVNLMLAMAAGVNLPAPRTMAEAGIIGFFGYGVSLVLFMLGLRHLGAARTGAYFASSPFIGAVMALALFHEPVTARLMLAGILMAVGLYLHLAESHEHEHVHELLEHDHLHVHDSHHRHTHCPDDPQGAPHSHPHRHGRTAHKHPHYPDLHHRHTHAPTSLEP